MQIINWNAFDTNLPKFTKKTTCTIGNFDGIHLGHTDLIKKTKLVAKQTNTASLIFIFYPKTKILFSQQKEEITPLSLKLKYLKTYQFDFCIIIDFDLNFAKQSKQWFINRLKNFFNVANIVVGSNFYFGKNKEGTISDLEQVFHVSNIFINEQKKISSSVIGDEIKKGNVETANKMLGKPLLISGIIVRGAQTATKLGFPTANFHLYENFLIPKIGIYAGYAWVGNKKYKAAIAVGKAPTLNKNRALIIEAHLLDFSGDLYDQYLLVSFEYFIRDEKIFDSIIDLKKSIQKDVWKCNDILI